MPVMHNGMIVIKSDLVYAGLMMGVFPPILVEMALHLHKLLDNRKIVAVVTSAYRKNDTGVHGFYRGIDYRCWELSEDQIESICLEINAKYEYDPARPDKECLIHHDTGRGPHFHLQSHPNTELKKK
jgi:hypothetical protein